jgi:hypothetical protein
LRNRARGIPPRFPSLADPEAAPSGTSYSQCNTLPSCKQDKTQFIAIRAARALRGVSADLSVPHRFVIARRKLARQSDHHAANRLFSGSNSAWYRRPGSPVVDAYMFCENSNFSIVRGVPLMRAYGFDYAVNVTTVMPCGPPTNTTCDVS